MNHRPVVVVGAGLAGLTCAGLLHRAGRPVQVLEREDAVGGRIRTDRVDGFLLDRGFQVYLTAYPDAARFLDLQALDLRRFEPGAVVHTEHGLQRLSDPWRRPGKAIQTAFAKVGSFADRVRIAKLRRRCRSGDVNQIWQQPEQTTLAELREIGFSDDVINAFFRPFLGGVFLDPNLDTTSRMLKFVFRMFSEGSAALPAAGMQAIPEQLAAALPADCVRLNCGVQQVEANSVRLHSGEVIEADHVVVAAEQPAASKLVPTVKSNRTPQSVRCVYFAAKRSPLQEPILVLNGTGQGLVNNVCVPTDVAATYSSDGRALVSVSVLRSDLSNDDLISSVREELLDWFGAQVKDWTALRSYSIPYALPNQEVPSQTSGQPESIRQDSILLCGDHCTDGSINGAIRSGEAAAERILQS